MANESNKPGNENQPGAGSSDKAPAPLKDVESGAVSGESTATNSQAQTPTVPGNIPTASVSDTQSLLENLAKMLASAPANPRYTPKPIEEYKFWKTQPVMKFESSVDGQGAIETKTVEEVPKEAKKLPQGFEWTVMDVTNDDHLQQIYDLLYENYIEDDDEQFRFRYSVPFLKWAMMPPGWDADWSVGVRAAASGKLVAFISAVPARLRVRGQNVPACEINFMCVHKKLRSKRLAPVLIAEITRRVNLRNIWQALYTGGTVLPSPISTCRYFHRTLDWPKLHDVGFAYLPPNSTEAEQVAKYTLPEKNDLAGFRLMQEKDLDAVYELLGAYLMRFELIQVFTKDELKHWLLSAPKFVHSYVVESPSGEITDFASFYGLESTVLGNHNHSSINVAYSFYYATSAPQGSPELRTRLTDLFQASLIEAKKLKYDVFNALTLLDNPLFLEDLKFGGGDGLLHFYLFNYRAKPVDGGMDKNGTITKPGGVGVVML